MSSFDSQRQESLKRMWQERRSVTAMDGTIWKHPFGYKLPNTMVPSLAPPFAPPNPINKTTLRSALSGGFDDDLVASVVPPVTVVLEGRSICQRISLHKHASYQSFARALRQMFVDVAAGDQNSSSSSDDHDDENVLDLSNAVPGHVIAYEDMENDLLLVGDLNWKDFVRVAKRIRILPAKAKSRKKKRELD